MIQVTNILRAVFFAPSRQGWGLPALLIGEPGVAKTDMIVRFATEYTVPTEVLSPGERGEGAFGVVPMPVKTAGGHRISYPQPSWVDQFDDSDGRGLVFVDEITTAPPAMQPALLGLVHSRRVGGAQLAKGVRVLGAANPPEQAASGWELSPPLANRFIHLPWQAPSVTTWTEWLLGSGTFEDDVVRLDAATEEARVLAAWGRAFARAKGLVAAFVRARPHLLHRLPQAGSPARGGAWPSRRTWEMATRAIASAEVQGLSAEERDLLVEGCVGSGAALELAEFAAANDLPDPLGVLTGEVKWTHDPARLDRTFAVLTGCTATLVSMRGEKNASADKLAETYWAILDTVMGTAADLLVPQVKPLSDARLVTKGAAPVLARLKPILDAARV